MRLVILLIGCLAATAMPGQTEGEIDLTLDLDDIYEGQIMRLPDLLYAADSAVLTPELTYVLDELSAFLIRNPAVRIEVGGHTNTKPQPVYCDKLSIERAKKVHDELRQLGVPARQLSYVGYGKHYPIYPDDKFDTDKQRANQRIEIKVLSVRD